MILALSTLWFSTGFAILILLFIYLITALYFTQRKNNATNKDIINRIDGRIWDMPVDLQCQMCKENVQIDFSLETNEFNCPRCNGYNKVMVQFITVATDKSWKSQK